ncbi:unnamed protein product [Rotaria sp. Silwood2]|nr:unnamed protein product [Rotaria sp. Silwood2]
MKWKKDHKLPNTKSKLPDQLPSASTSPDCSLPNIIKKEEEEEEEDEDQDEQEQEHEQDIDSIGISNFIKEESFSDNSSN